MTTEQERQANIDVSDLVESVSGRPLTEQVQVLAMQAIRYRRKLVECRAAIVRMGGEGEE